MADVLFPAQPEIEEVMRTFKRGFGKADPELLAAAITDDFEWHTHTFDGPDAQPTGTVLRGLDEVMAEIHRRRENWSEVRFDDMVERYLPDLVVQTFVISGIDQNGNRFNNAAVDLYPIVDGRIARKQTYWKQPV